MPGAKLRVEGSAGRFRASYTRADGTRVARAFATKAEALRWLKANRGG